MARANARQQHKKMKVKISSEYKSEFAKCSLEQQATACWLTLLIQVDVYATQRDVSGRVKFNGREWAVIDGFLLVHFHIEFIADLCVKQTLVFLFSANIWKG